MCFLGHIAFKVLNVGYLKNENATFALYNCRYIAAVDGAVSKQNLITISEGTIIDGVHCTPDSVELLPRQPDISRPRLRIVVLYPSIL